MTTKKRKTRTEVTIRTHRFTPNAVRLDSHNGMEDELNVMVFKRMREMEVWSLEALKEEGNGVFEAEGLGKEVKIFTIPISSRSSNLLVTNN